jgi:hypothetical protein
VIESTALRTIPGALLRVAKPSSAVVMNTTSSQMFGVAAAQLGSFARQITFSVSLQLTGRLLAVVLVPFRWGPRHCGQFAAGSAALSFNAAINRKTADKRKNLIPISALRKILSHHNKRPKAERRRAAIGYTILAIECGTKS